MRHSIPTTPPDDPLGAAAGCLIVVVLLEQPIYIVIPIYNVLSLSSIDRTT